MQIHDANLKHNGNWSYRNSTSEIILHHAEASHASVEDINQWHLERGWAGIGYNYYVRKDGTIWRGRPEWSVGAHAKGHNDKSIGICCEGAYMVETMPAAQLAALKDLIRDIMSRYGKLKLLRHKDVNETDCPGVNFPWAEVQKYAEPDTAKEETEVVEKKNVMLNGKTYTCECITKDEVNYIKMRALWSRQALRSATMQSVSCRVSPHRSAARSFRTVRRTFRLLSTPFRRPRRSGGADD